MRLILPSAIHVLMGILLLMEFVFFHVLMQIVFNVQLLQHVPVVKLVLEYNLGLVWPVELAVLIVPQHLHVLSVLLGISVIVGHARHVLQDVVLALMLILVHKVVKFKSDLQ